MVFVQLARWLRAQPLRSQLLDLEDDGATRRVRAQFVADAHGLAGACGDPVDLDQAALASVMSLGSRLENACGAEPAIDTNLVTHQGMIAEARAASKRKPGSAACRRGAHQFW